MDEETLEEIFALITHGAGQDPTSSSAISSDPKACHRQAAVLQRLYKLRLQALLRAHATVLLRCGACGELFSAAAQGKLQCRQPAARPASGGRSAPALPLHTPDPAWCFSDHLRHLRARRQTHREVYWHVWGLMQVLHCSACHAHYPARQHGHCGYHPQAAAFASEAAAGVFPCCGVRGWGACVNPCFGVFLQ